MKRTALAILISLFIVQIGYSVIPVKNEITPSEKTNLLSLVEQVHDLYTVRMFKKITGRKPNIQERLGLKYLQITAKKAYKSSLARDTTEIPAGCDLITLRNGDEIQVKIVSVSRSKVRYTKCNAKNKAIYTKSRFILEKINYSNGTEHILDSDEFYSEDGELIESHFSENTNLTEIPEGCDLILFNSGEELEVIVEEVGDTKVKYKKCDKPNGPTYTKSRFILSKIHYANGVQQSLTKGEILDEEGEIIKSDYVDGANNVGIVVAGILMFFVLNLLGLLVGLAIKKGPKRKAFYKGYLIGLGLFAIYLLIILSTVI